MKTNKLIGIIALGSAVLMLSCNNIGSNKNSKTEEVNAEKITEEVVNQELPVKMIPNSPEGAEAYFSPDDKSLIFNGKTMPMGLLTGWPCGLWPCFVGDPF